MNPYYRKTIIIIFSALAFQAAAQTVPDRLQGLAPDRSPGLAIIFPHRCLLPTDRAYDSENHR